MPGGAEAILAAAARGEPREEAPPEAAPLEEAPPEEAPLEEAPLEAAPPEEARLALRIAFAREGYVKLAGAFPRPLM